MPNKGINLLSSSFHMRNDINIAYSYANEYIRVDKSLLPTPKNNLPFLFKCDHLNLVILSAGVISSFSCVINSNFPKV